MPKYVKNKEELAEKIRLAREHADLSQKQVADFLFKERSTYTYYELGITVPSFFDLLKLADIFGVSFESLISENKN